MHYIEWARFAYMCICSDDEEICGGEVFVVHVAGYSYTVRACTYSIMVVIISKPTLRNE